jgi:L-ascorbate metabolism protein UlaG (beta-lactamase superfamily)
MIIQWFGHSCYMINGSLVIDPYKDGSVPGYAPLRLSADEVICTHEHADHSGRECITPSGTPCALNIKTVNSYHDNQNGTLRGPNTIFIVESGNEKLVHLGDLGHFPNDAQLAVISNADYLLIPVGGYYTIDAETATKICEAAAPKTIIPMHYRWHDGATTYGYPKIDTLDRFMDAIKKTTLAQNVAIQELTRN